MSKIAEIIPKYKHSEIEFFDNEHKFMDAYVELLKQTIELVYRIIEAAYFDEDEIPLKISKEEAVLGGNLVRLVKLNTSFLQNICESKMEICYIINRCIAETFINTKYILVEGEDRVKRNYIKHSLITEKELWETILTNIKGRNGNVLPIEERMQSSIKRCFDESDFDFDEVQKSSKWKSIKSRAEQVSNEMFYSVYYGLSSHSVHGNWQDILVNNLEKEDDGFKLNLSWNRPRPQIMDGPIVLNIEIVKAFCENGVIKNETSSLIKDKCVELTEYILCLSNAHERWMNK